MLGIANYSSSRPKWPPSVTAAASKVINTTETENIPLRELIARTDNALDSMDSLVNAKTNTDMELPPSMNIRDIIALDKTLQQINGQAKVAAAKISALEDGIVKLEDELESEDLTPEEREKSRRTSNSLK